MCLALLLVLASSSQLLQKAMALLQLKPALRARTRFSQPDLQRGNIHGPVVPGNERGVKTLESHGAIRRQVSQFRNDIQSSTI